MRRLEPREYTLLGLLAVAAVVALWINSGGGFGGGGDREELPEFTLGEPPRVAMDRLEPNGVGYDPADRNLFAYYTPPRQAPIRQAPPIVKNPAPPPPPPKRPQPEQPTNVTPPAPAAPRPPSPNFRFIGRMGPPTALIAAIEVDNENEIVIARVGDVVEDEFKLVGFTYDSIVLGYTDERFKDKTTELTQQVQKR